MHIPLLVKLRIALIIAVALFAFVWVGWPHIQTGPDGLPLTIVHHAAPVKAYAIVAILTVVVTLCALIIARPYAASLAPLAVPAGLIGWAYKSANMTSLLIEHHGVADRSSFFLSLIPDTFIWLSLLVISYLIIALWIRLAKPKKTSLDSDESLDPQADLINDRPAPYLPAVNPMLANILALAVTVGLAIILLKITARSGTVNLDHLPQVPLVSTVPQTGQILFAVAASFFLAVLAAFHLFAVPLTTLLLAPPIVAVIAYIAAAYNPLRKILENEAPVFVPASVTWSTILPLQFIAVGSLAVIAAFWFAISLHPPKEE